VGDLSIETLPHVVIVGGGFGGLYAALELGKAPVRVTIVDRRNYHLFQPLLYQVASAALSPGDIAQPIRSVVRRQANTAVVLAEVLSIDVANRRLLLDDGEIRYDHLILAAGAGHSYFGHDEWASEAPALKTLEDALDIRRRVLVAFEAAERLAADRMLEAGGSSNAVSSMEQAYLTFLVIGGGPTGVELAGALSEVARQTLSRDFRAIDPSKARVVLVEAGPRVLGTFPESLSKSAAAQLEKLGVEVKSGCKLAEIIHGRGVRLENGPESANPGQEWIAAHTVLWAAGVEASPLARSLGAPVDRAGRVLVEADLSIPGHPEIRAIGDLASFLHQTGKPLPGVAPVAIQQGRHAARNIQRALHGAAPVPFRYRDRGNLATIGRSAAVADIAHLRLSGWFAWITWAFVHIFFLIGFRNRVLVMFEWAWLWFTHQRGARLITGEDPPHSAPPTDETRTTLAAGSTGAAAGSTGAATSPAGVAAGSTGASAGSTGATASSAGVAADSTGAAAESAERSQRG
jgi:NADH dehydrogenase